MPFQLYKIPDAPKFIRFLHKEKQIIITKRLSDARFSIYYFFFEMGLPQPLHQNDAYGRFITLF
jgi:hypothetical protein